ncbi:MAG: lasso peptide biosynthesis PqqD family chaperone [Acaryochloridaceae cyanobacterium RL_2_7]|nr:lasso peptide biosynthesis PqqD family chaperone [Acaryochloridaceae cyanobacterium RL_2_7]
MALTQNTTILAAPDQVSSELAGESVILNLKTGLYYGLNEVGAKIWEQIQSPKTFQEVCDAITAEYEVAAEECTQDVQELLEEMIQANLVNIQDEAT